MLTISLHIYCVLKNVITQDLFSGGFKYDGQLGTYDGDWLIADSYPHQEVSA